MIATALTGNEFIRIKGPDTIDFLQGQVSCDMTQLRADNSLVGALCNLQGRVITDFRLLLDGEDCLMQTGSGMADRVLAVLGKYAVFSKVELSRDDKIAAVIGLYGADSELLMEEFQAAIPATAGACVRTGQAWLLRLPGNESRFEVWCSNKDFAENLLNSAGGQSAAHSNAWLRQDILQGIIHVSPALSEQYTPQLLNYDISGVINFKKGCYTGQEVVARMYYRGKAKKRLQLLYSAEPVEADSRVQSPDNGKQFDILAYCNADSEDAEQHVMLAVVDTQLIDDGAELELSNRPGARLNVGRLAYVSGAADSGG